MFQGLPPHILLKPYENEKRELDEKGYLVIPNLMDSEFLGELRRRLEELHEHEGEDAGKEVHQEDGARRLSNLVNKGELFKSVIMNRKLLGCISHVLRGDFKLSSLNARFALPGQGHQQFHQDSGPGDGVHHEACNSLWLLDDLSKANGATRVVPGSHRLAKSPHGEMQDVYANHPDQTYITAPAGSVVVFNSHLWHAGSLNTTEMERRVMHCYFCRRSSPQQTNQREYLSRETIENCDASTRYVLDVA